MIQVFYSHLQPENTFLMFDQIKPRQNYQSYWYNTSERILDKTLITRLDVILVIEEITLKNNFSNMLFQSLPICIAPINNFC